MRGRDSGFSVFAQQSLGMFRLSTLRHLSLLMLPAMKQLYPQMHSGQVLELPCDRARLRSSVGFRTERTPSTAFSPNASWRKGPLRLLRRGSRTEGRGHVDQARRLVIEEALRSDDFWIAPWSLPHAVSPSPGTHPLQPPAGSIALLIEDDPTLEFLYEACDQLRVAGVWEVSVLSRASPKRLLKALHPSRRPWVVLSAALDVEDSQELRRVDSPYGFLNLVAMT